MDGERTMTSGYIGTEPFGIGISYLHIKYETLVQYLLLQFSTWCFGQLTLDSLAYKIHECMCYSPLHVPDIYQSINSGTSPKFVMGTELNFFC